MVGAEDVGGAVGDAGPDRRRDAARRAPAGSSAGACRGAHSRRAEKREVVRRHLDRGDVLVVGEEAHLLGGRDVQDVDERAGLARDRDEPPRGGERRLRRRARRDGSTDRRGGARRKRVAQAELVLGVEGGAAPRAFARIARTPSSSATSRSPVEEPMNTLMPAAPGRRSSSGMSSTFSAVPPTQKAWSQCMRPRARASLSASAVGADGERVGVRHLEDGGDAAHHRRAASRFPGPPCARRPARGNAPACR